ncbi:MAG: hypothetical protein ACLFO5_08285 [Opitutales bacterium]
MKITRSYLFLPPEEGYSQAAMKRHGFKRIEGDLTLHWLKEAESANGVCVFFHGNGENALENAELAEDIAAKSHRDRKISMLRRFD